jgi:hypothetical protein
MLGELSKVNETDQGTIGRHMVRDAEAVRQSFVFLRTQKLGREDRGIRTSVFRGIDDAPKRQRLVLVGLLR